VTGVVSLEEARQGPEDERSSTSVAQILHPLDEHVTIPPQAPLSEALQKMAREDTGRLLVMQDARLQGMITRTGLLRFLELRHALASPQ
ncbi:MAG: CBS domain-containing protein, partial [Candidatus Tectimicrobiota bacterium]